MQSAFLLLLRPLSFQVILGQRYSALRELYFLLRRYCSQDDGTVSVEWALFPTGRARLMHRRTRRRSLLWQGQCDLTLIDGQFLLPWRRRASGGAVEV